MKFPNFSHNRRAKEYTLVFAGVFANFCQSVTYAWLTPLLYYFKQPGSSLFLTPLETTWLTIMCDLSSAIFCIPVSYAADIFGRKPVLWATGPICIISWLLVIFMQNSVGLLFAMRAVQGVSVAIADTVLPIYLSEVASVEVRGGVVSFMNTLWHAGMVYVYIVILFCGFDGLTWFTLAPNIIFTIAFYLCPESPYYLLMKNRKQDAIENLVQIRGGSSTDRNIIDEIETMAETVKKDKELNKGILKNIVYSRKDRKSFLIIEGITIVYMLVGCNTIAINASDTIAILSGSINFANYITVILGFALLLMTIPSVILSDRWGRRPILLLSSAATVFLFLAGAIMLYFIQIKGVDSTVLTTFAYLCMLLGACFNTFGIETLQEVLVGELFPTNARSVAAGITYTFYTASSVLSLSLYSYLEDSAGIYANYFVFASFSAVGFLIYWLILPETKGKTFGEIQDSL